MVIGPSREHKGRHNKGIAKGLLLLIVDEGGGGEDFLTTSISRWKHLRTLAVKDMPMAAD